MAQFKIQTGTIPKNTRRVGLPRARWQSRFRRGFFAECTATIDLLLPGQWFWATRKYPTKDEAFVARKNLSVRMTMDGVSKIAGTKVRNNRVLIYRK